MSYADANTSEMPDDDRAVYQEALRQILAAKARGENVREPKPMEDEQSDEQYAATHGYAPNPDKTVGKITAQNKAGTISPEDKKNYNFILPTNDNHAPVPVSKALAGDQRDENDAPTDDSMHSPTRHNLPYPSIVGPGDMDYRQKMMDQLQKKMDEQDRGAEYGQQNPSGYDYDSANRGNSLVSLLGHAAAQAGSVHGHIADASPLDDNAKNLRSISDHRESMGQKQDDDRRQLQEYLMQKIQGEEGGVNHLMESDAEMQARGIDRENQQNFLAEMEKSRAKDAMAQRAADADSAAQRAREANATKVQVQELRNTGSAANQAAKAKGAGTAKQSKISSAAATQIGQLDGIYPMLDELSKEWDDHAASRFSGIKSLNPASEAGQYDVRRRQFAQSIGNALKGNRAVTAQELEAYTHNLPGPWDTPAMKKNKLDGFRHEIEMRKAGIRQGLGESGYNISGVAKSPGMIPDSQMGLGNQGGGGKPAPNGKQSVMQNGHQYDWNPQTGQYE